MSTSGDKLKAREQVIRSVLRLVGSERDEPHAHYDDELEYAQDEVDRAACELAAAVVRSFAQPKENTT